MSYPHQTGTASQLLLRRSLVRHVAAGLCLATAVVYAAIGLGVVTVVDEVSPDAPPMLMFGVSAAATFILGAALLARLDHRALWAAGAVYQIGVIVAYVNVAPQRTPPFEAWGILIKVLQLGILLALAYLLVRSPKHDRT